MTGGPWWMDPEEILGRPPLFPVTKPAELDKEALRLPAELKVSPQHSSVVDAYVSGTVNAISERLERAAEAMLTDAQARGILVLEEQVTSFDHNTITFRVVTYLHPNVPFGEIHHHKVESIRTYLDNDVAVSEGRARLIG